MKWNFSSAQLHQPYVVRKLSISQVQIYSFTRIGHKIKRLRLLIIPPRRRSDERGLRQPPKGVNYNFPRRYLDESYVVASSRSRKLKYAISAGLAQSEYNWSSLKRVHENLGKFCSTEHFTCACGGVDKFSLAQFTEPYYIEKLSIS